MYANPYRWWNLIIFGVMTAVYVVVANLAATKDVISLISVPMESWLAPVQYVLYIWGLIYVLLLGYTIYQLRRSTRTRDSVRRIGPWFILYSACTSVWVVAWYYEWIIWTFVLGLMMFITAYAIYSRSRQSNERIRTGERLFVYWPFSFLLSWQLLITLMNLSIVLELSTWSKFGLEADSWAIILLLFACVFAIVIGFAYRDGAYMLVFVWTSVGIAANWRTVDTSGIVWMVAATTGIIVLLLMVIMLIRTKINRRPRLRFK